MLTTRSESEHIGIFFGASTGRTATMTFSNALNSEVATTCLHEGKFRHEEISGQQLLPYLTLENRLAYETRSSAVEIISKKRSGLIELAKTRGDSWFGDIAYNNSLFVSALAAHYPEAKFVVFFRDCLDFIRSATSLEGKDDAPVGWPPANKPLSDVERFIALGRLQPHEGSNASEQWQVWSHLAKNIWLWSETNRLLLDQIDTLPTRRWHRVNFAQFKADPVKSYHEVRSFLGFANEIRKETLHVLMDRPINLRNGKPDPINLSDLDQTERRVYDQYALPVHERLFP
jgi:hypothetical protein